MDRENSKRNVNTRNDNSCLAELFRHFRCGQYNYREEPLYCAQQRRSGIAAASCCCCCSWSHVNDASCTMCRRSVRLYRWHESGLLFIFNRRGASVGERASLLWLTRSRFAVRGIVLGRCTVYIRSKQRVEWVNSVF